MKQDPEGMSRRELFGRLFAPLRARLPSDEIPKPRELPAARVAVIAGRHCVAYEGVPCNACLDHCPEAGAIVMEDGLPRIEMALCTGCTLCEPVCPAPVKAIQFIPRPEHLPPVKRP